MDQRSLVMEQRRALAFQQIDQLSRQRFAKAANRLEKDIAVTVATDIAIPQRQSKAVTMSITGYQPGSIKARLEDLKARSASRRAGAWDKVAAADAKAAGVDAQIEQVAAQIEKEADDALQEFATFTNGGPA
jgi:hypothetical protein